MQRPPRPPPDIALRGWEPGDAQALHAAVRGSLPSLSAWFPWARPDYSLDDARGWIAHCIRARELGDEYHFGVFDAGTGMALGSVGLNHHIRANRCANLGYWVAGSARGRGVATAAARQAARFGFDTVGLQRISILVHPDNHASLRVAAALGAVREGVARNGLVLDGRPHDAVLHSLLPADLRGSTPE